MTRAKDLPWLPLYTRDLRAATEHWTDEEFGCYMRLLVHQWDHGSIPEDPKRRAMIAPSSRKHWLLIGPKFPGGVNARMAKERATRDDLAAERSEIGRIGASRRWQSHAASDGKGNASGNGKRHGKSMACQSQSQSQKTEQDQEHASHVATTDAKPSARRTKSGCSIRWADGVWSGITEADRTGWRAAFPACDIDRQLASMSAWLAANPAKAHKSNWSRFIVAWLTRSQDRGGDTASTRPASAGSAEERRAKQRAAEFPEALNLPIVRISQ